MTVPDQHVQGEFPRQSARKWTSVPFSQTSPTIRGSGGEGGGLLPRKASTGLGQARKQNSGSMNDTDTNPTWRAPAPETRLSPRNDSHLHKSL